MSTRGLFLTLAFVCISSPVFAKSADEFPAPIAKVLGQIEEFTGGSYDWEFVPDLPNAALSVTGGHLLINPNMWKTLSPYAIFFAILHEIGHQKLGHLDPKNAGGRTQRWVSKDKEIEADVYAAKKMVESGIVEGKVRAAAKELFFGSPGDATHPPGTERIKHIEKALDGGSASSEPGRRQNGAGEFAAAISDLLDALPTQFRAYRSGAGKNDGAHIVWNSSLQIPGTQTSQVWQEPSDGDIFFHADVIKTSDESIAEKVFQETAAKVQSALPRGWQFDPPKDESDPRKMWSARKGLTGPSVNVHRHLVVGHAYRISISIMSAH